MGAGEEHQPEPSHENVSAASSISAIAEDLQRTVVQSKDSAIRSARSLQEASSSHIRSFQDFVPRATSQFKTHEDAFFRKVKDEFKIAREHPAATIGVAVTAGLLIMRGPRRFLFRHTFGRFQTEEANFLKAEKHVKELNLSVDLMKKESKKLLERAALAEKDMKYGHNELMNAGSQIQHLSRSIYKAEAQAAGTKIHLSYIFNKNSWLLHSSCTIHGVDCNHIIHFLITRLWKVKNSGEWEVCWLVVFWRFVGLSLGGQITLISAKGPTFS